MVSRRMQFVKSDDAFALFGGLTVNLDHRIAYKKKDWAPDSGVYLELLG